MENENTVENISELQEALKHALKQVAVPLEKIEFTRDNYNKLFPYSKIETPIESVKMGANQFEKLETKERQNLLLAVHDTLKNPDLIINEQKENVFGENEDNHIYAKSFLIDDKVHGVQSVVVSIDGENVSISTHERSINNIVNKIKKPDQLLYAAAKVRLLVERVTGNQLVTVNPTRENEYVVSPRSNLHQNSESVKHKENLIIDANQVARIKAAREIKENMPNLSEDERAAAIAILEAGAKSQGMSISEYVEKTFPDGIFGNIKNAQNAARQQGIEINGAVSIERFGENVKAVIYAGKTADFSTWCHELSHIWQAQLTGELKQNAEEAFQVKNSDWQNSIYTFEDGRTDSSAEAFAYGFEDFLKKNAGEMVTEDKKKIFEKFADYMSRTYNGVKQHIKINEKITSVYQKLIELDDNILAQAEKAVLMEKEHDDFFDKKYLNAIFKLDDDYNAKIDELIKAVDSGISEKVEKELGNVNAAFVALAKKNGEDLEGYAHSIDSYFIKHDRKRHGIEKSAIEKELGQISITDDDIRKIPSVIESPDYIVFGVKNRQHNNTVIYVKNMEDGSSLYVEEERTRSKHLAANTFYKMAAASNATSISRIPTLYVQNDRNTIKIVDVKNEFVNDNVLFQTAYHGSSASFDKFNTSEYGMSGEGSMTFGYGAYVSNSEYIAKSYAGIQGDRNLYTVEIPDGDYIVWNKSVSKSQKEKVKNELYEKLIKEDYKGAETQIFTELDNIFETELDGNHLYGTVSSYIGSDKETSEFLNNLGFSGIQYPASDSEKSTNYVIFNDNDIKIKNHFQFQILGEIGVSNLDRAEQTENRTKNISELQEALKDALKEVAVPLEKIEFTRDNYNKLFPYSKIETPIESVKMGANQFEKLETKERQNLLLAVHDTLKNPDLIINEQKENVFGENEDNHIYAKSFLIDDKVHGVQSVVVSIDGENVSVSTHERSINNIVNKIKKPDQLLYAAAKVRLLVERVTGNQLVTVNPTRENEYVVSPQSNIQQETESVKHKENLIIDANQVARIKTAREIKENMPNLSEKERAAAIAILEAGAKSQRMNLSEYVEKTFPDGIFGDIKNAQNAARQQGIEINGAVSIDRFGENVKAVIYASKTADFSTWCHELSHIWQAQLTGELKQNAEEAFQVKNSDWQNSIYTFEDGRTDSSAEAFAYGFEDFLKKNAGEMVTEDKKKIFEKFADYMSRTYNGVKQHIKINEKITSVYQKLIELDDNILAQAEKAVRLEMEKEQKINEIINSPNLKTSQKVSETIGLVSDKFADLASQYGYDIRGYSHTIDNFFVSHALKQHGDKEAEEKRGNIAITHSDICNVFSVYTHPDYIIFGTKTKTGNPAIVYVKNIGDSTIFVEDVRSGKKELAAQTLYKKSGTIDVSSKKEAPELYAHSDPESISIVDVKNEFVNDNVLFQTAYHGSGASFDKFNTSEYGMSGEGSMAFGYGAYVSNSEYIAKNQNVVMEEKMENEKRVDWLKTPTGKKSELSPGEWFFAHSTEFKEQYGDWESKIKKDFLLGNDIVSELTGNEFSKKEGVTLTEQVEQYFNEMNNSVESPFFGKVVLDKDGADASLSHGMGRLKAIAYASVPAVIKNGVIIDSDLNHKDRGYNSYVIAAPIKISNENYICEVVLKQNKNENQFYLHEVTEQKKFLERAFVTNSAQKPAHQGTLSILLEKSLAVNNEISCPLSMNGEPEKSFIKNIMIETELSNYESQEYWKSKFVEENSETFKAIDEYLDNGISPKNNEFIIKRTPEILVSTNISQNEIVLTTGVINKAKNIHSLTNEEIKDSFRAFAAPLIIFDSDKERSENKENSVLVITDKFAQNNKPIAFSVNMDTQRKGYEQRVTINEIRSIHDRTIVAKNGVNIFNEWVDKGLCRYVDDKKIAQERLDSFQLPQATSSEQQLAAGLQFPLALLNSDNHNLMTFTAFVNEEKEKEKEFREWDDGTYSEETSRRIDSGEIFGTYEAMENSETIDNDIEQLQANHGLSEKAIENSYYAEQNSNPDYLDENGNPHWYSDEENEINDGISDEELIRIYKQKYPDSSLSISEDTRKELENVFSQIDDYLDKGTVPEERRFTLPKTPSYLQELGSDETVISLPVSVIKKAKETHGLSNEEIKNSLLRFYDPVVVFDTDKEKSENKQDSKLILTDEFAENKPIALAVNTNSQIQIQESGHRKFIEVQDIRSIHDRSLIAKNGTDLIKQWTENGLCRYVDDKKISDWSTVARVYFPIEALQSDKNNILIKSEIVNSQEKPELKTYHTLKEEDVKNLKIISDEEFSDIVDSIILNDYKNIPNTIRLPNLNAELSEKLGLEKDSAFILKKSATHIRPDRKNGYGQAFDTEEYREIPEIIRNAKFAVVDNYFQNFQIVFDDKNNDEKINKLVFNKDELGNYLVTIGKVERESSFSEERNSVVAVGVAPTIQTLRTRASSTALRASTTTATENIQQETESVKQEVPGGIRMFGQDTIEIAKKIEEKEKTENQEKGHSANVKKVDIVKKGATDFLNSVKNGTAPFLNKKGEDFGKITINPPLIVNAYTGLPFSGEAQLLSQIYYERQQMQGEIVTSFAGAKSAGTAIVANEASKKNFVLADTHLSGGKNVVFKNRYFSPEACEEPEKIYALALAKQRPQKLEEYRYLIKHFEKVPNGQKEIADIRTRIAEEHLKELRIKFASVETPDLSLKEIAERKDFIKDYFNRLPNDVRDIEKSTFQNIYGIVIDVEKDFSGTQFSEAARKEMESHLTEFVVKNSMSEKKLAFLSKSEYEEQLKIQKQIGKSVKIDATGIKEPELYLGKYLAACQTNAEFITDSETIDAVQKNLAKKLETNFRLEKFGIVKEIGRQAERVCKETVQETSFKLAHSNKKENKQSIEISKSVVPGMGK